LNRRRMQPSPDEWLDLSDIFPLSRKEPSKVPLFADYLGLGTAKNKSDFEMLKEKGDPFVQRLREEDQKIIDGMATRKLDKQERPEKYLPETANQTEKGLVKDVNIKQVKKEINDKGGPPEDILAEAMRGNRVLGIPAFPAGGMQDQADFALRTMAKLKEAGATHLAVPFSQEVLDEFNRTGKVDLSKLPKAYINDVTGAYMQAALFNNIKLVASDGDKNAEMESKAVLNVLKDKNAKVVLISETERLANAVDRDGAKSVTQLLRKEKDPASPDKALSVATVSMHVAGNGAVDPFAYLFEDLKQSTAVVTGKTPTLAGVKAGMEFRYEKPQNLGSWDITVLLPRVK